MAHIKMMHAVQIRKALESGEDAGEVATRYNISVDQALGYLPAKAEATEDEVEEDTRSRQQKSADTRKANKEAEGKDDFAS